MAKWNREQQQVIDSRHANILVSAAAGSGKTAVLVERILKMVTDEDMPCDIDEFLVVTFTNAAAAQMREKISAKLEKAVREHPENSHLVKQLSLIHKADITTIDSFCLKVVKENFHSIGVDSAFTIMDNHLMELLKEDILDGIFQEHYEAAFRKDDKEDTFVRLVRAFGSMKNDDALKDIILQICRTAESLSDPVKWLQAAKENNHIETEEDLDRAAWMKAYLADIHGKAESFLSYAEYGREICGWEGGCGNNAEVAEGDIFIIRKILEAETYGELREAFLLPVANLKAVRKDGKAKENYQVFAGNREKYIKPLKEMMKNPKKVSDVLKEMSNIREWTDTMLDLCLEYRERLMEEKNRRKQYEFSDISHMALKILCQGYDENHTAVPTETGRSISERYREIFIDEYQDSNYIQEDILTCVSRRHAGCHNMFMVGDVKQSIYKFRMARPDLFLEKYASYVESDEDNQENRLINLKTNYRSRPVVLDAVNYIFRNIMNTDFGGIAYDDKAALKYGGLYQETDCETSNTAELLLVAKDSGENQTLPDSDAEELTALEYEAYAVAGRIKELTDPEKGIFIWDEESGEYIRARYRDCMILLRSVKGKGGIFEKILQQEGIPVSLDNPNGYFDAAEVTTMLSMLTVIDNARQDIPLAAVLLSPMGKLSNDEMAFVSACPVPEGKKKYCLYDKCIMFMELYENSKQEEYAKTAGKLRAVFQIVSYLKQQRPFTPISVLIQKVLDLTHYDIYISALPQGTKRIANINMLMEKAEVFEHGDYRGLFNFLRYMEKVRIHDLDFGEAKEVGSSENAVRITTMHKSKGLEYPIVFVSGLGHPFVSNYKRGSITIHQDYYIAARYIDPDKKIRHNSFMQDSFNRLLTLDSLAEEQRVLYVAMTRAREKLILTGSVSRISEKTDIDYLLRTEAGSYLGWIMPCINRDDTERYFQKTYMERSSITASYAAEQTERILRYDDMERLLSGQKQERSVKEAECRYKYQYPHQEAATQKVKMSVSEIKKMAMYEQGMEDEAVYTFVKSADRNSGGARRGTVIHKLMELLDFKSVDSRGKMEEELYRLLQMDLFEEEDRNIKGIEGAAAFYDSDLFRRMKKADMHGLLYKEKQFTMGIPANQIMKDTENSDMVVVQGIVDAYFYEGEEIVLMDYKTDAVPDTETLVKRYQKQLDCYAETLEHLTGHTVKEKLIYSFSLGKVIKC